MLLRPIACKCTMDWLWLQTFVWIETAWCLRVTFLCLQCLQTILEDTKKWVDTQNSLHGGQSWTKWALAQQVWPCANTSRKSSKFCCRCHPWRTVWKCNKGSRSGDFILKLIYTDPLLVCLRFILVRLSWLLILSGLIFAEIWCLYGTPYIRSGDYCSECCLSSQGIVCYPMS